MTLQAGGRSAIDFAQACIPEPEACELVMMPKICEGLDCGITFYRRSGSQERICHRCRRKELQMRGGVVTELANERRRIA